MEIVFENVTIIKNRNTNFQKTVLKDLNITIKSGTIHGICGDSGKSTIGRGILALEDIWSGKIKVGNFVINRSKIVKKINKLRFTVGYLPQKPEDFLYHKTVRSELEFSMKYFKYKLNAIQSRPEAALRMVGLNESYLARNPLELSYSEQKKVMLAAVLSYNPEIIIFDEFEKGLTKSDKKNIKKLLKMLKDKYGKTIIVISNDASFMHDLCEHIHVIKSGSLAMSGTKELFQSKEIYKYIDMPKITEFIRFLNSKDIKMPEYIDIKELLKAVYRDVK